MSFGERLYRLLLRFLPSEFRGDFGDAMLADMNGDGRVNSTRHSASFWRREIAGLLAAVMREHIDALRQDVKYSLRLMRRTPGFTSLAVLMLAIGTGANVAMFSVIDAVMLRSPFVNSDRLVRVNETQFEDGERKAPTHERYAEVAGNPGALSAVAQQWGGSHILALDGELRNFDNVECVSSSVFAVAGTTPAVGRVFGADEDRAGAAPVIVLSDSFWHQLGGSPSILGSTLTINATPTTVIGVMPRGYNGMLSRANVQGWVPISRPIVGAGNLGCPTSGIVMLFGRLAPGASLTDATSRLHDLSVTPLVASGLDDVQLQLKILAAAVAAVLLIACLNVGGLQMERTLARRREMAVRVSLGASTWRLGRQILTENVILALAGAIAGVGITALTLSGLTSLLPSNLPHIAEIEINLRVLAAALLIAGAAGIVAGTLPLLQLRRVNPGVDLAGSGRSSERRQGWTRRALIVTEIGVSIVVLISAALLVQTFFILRPDHPGFDPTHKVTLVVRLRGEPPQTARVFYPELLDRLKEQPTITGAAATTYVPMGGSSGIAYITLDHKRGYVWGNSVTTGFFDLLKIPLVAGRMFTDADTATSEPVIIINELLAKRIRPDGNLVGQRIAIGAVDGSPKAPDEQRLVVGIAANMRSAGGDLRPRSEAWEPFAQTSSTMLTIVASAAPGHDAEAARDLRATVHSLRPNLVLSDTRTMQSNLDRSMVFARLGAWLLGLFASLAVALAGTGLLTTMSWWVSQRVREVGVRMALGATSAQVNTLVLRQGVTLAAAGIAAGLIAASGVTRYLKGWIYGVAPIDPATFAGCAAGMLVIAIAAVLIPMRRATRVNPVTALRAE